jgi:hypothetical protein
MSNLRLRILQVDADDVVMTCVDADTNETLDPIRVPVADVPENLRASLLVVVDDLPDLFATKHEERAGERELSKDRTIARLEAELAAARAAVEAKS